MLHRDIKPDNILLDGGVVKVSDFGLSKLVGAMTRSATFKGGQHMLYMAPEGWLGEQNAIQIDMYSTGLVMFEIATLAFAYRMPATWQVVEPFRQMHLFERPFGALSATRSDFRGFDRFVIQLLAKRPADRFSSGPQRARHSTRPGEAPRPPQRATNP